MTDDPGIDPRYAAQFQRGYDPAVHGSPGAARRTPESVGPVRLSGGPPPSAPRVPAPPRLAAAPSTPVVASPAEAIVVRGVEPDAADAERGLRLDRHFAALGAALLAASIAVSVVGTTWGTEFLTPSFDARAEVARSVLHAVPGPLFAAGAILTAVAVRRPLGAHRLGVPGLFAVAGLIVLLVGLATAGAGDELARTQAYWVQGNPTLEQQYEMSRAQNAVTALLDAVPWLVVSVVGLVVLGLRTQARQAGSASATASRDASRSSSRVSGSAESSSAS